GGTVVADLGTVDARAASEYFFALVPRLEPTGSHDRVLLPAVLADNPAAVASLLALVRENARTERIRREAVQWIGLLGDSTVIPSLVRLATDGADRRDGGSERGLSGAAVAALSHLDGHVGIPALMQLARSGPMGTRRNAVFWLGQSGDPRGIRLLHTVIEDTHEDDAVRKHAIFSLGNSDEVPPSELAYLRAVYARLNHDVLKESVFQAMSGERAAGGAWLLQRASDAGESLALRKKALFWSGQRASTSTADLVSVYRSASEASLREHAIFVLSQRQDESATDALMHIARDDADSRMRGRALFWLAQKHDPRVTKLIADLVLK
ncbi:MAG: HEAT repeat domain-containing protein, partial [bacterium]